MRTRTIVIGLAVLLFIAGASALAKPSDIATPCSLGAKIGSSTRVYVRVRGTARIFGGAITFGDGCTLANRVYVDVRPGGREARGGNPMYKLRRLQRESGVSYPHKGLTVIAVSYKFATVDLEGWLHQNPQFDNSKGRLEDPSWLPLNDGVIRSVYPLVLDVTRVYGISSLQAPSTSTTPN